jgi:6,7-dimethyl-8-ribityllumazine synthase
VNRIDEPEGQGDARTRTPDAAEDLELASENVLDGWPAAPPPETEDEARDPLDFSREGEEAPDAIDDGAEPDAEADEPAGVAPAELEEPALGDALERELDGPGLDEAVEASSEHAPGDLVVPPGYAVLEGQPQGRRRAVGIVVSRFNGEVTGGLLDSALDELAACGVGHDSITVMPVPGAFELPIAAMALAKTRRFACIVALGCVIRGDTPHFDYVASEAASGLQLAAIETGVPVAFGVLTLDRPDQAEPRFAKGAEAVRTALEMADLFANLRAAAAR